MDYRQNKRWLSWLLSILYAVTDEIHQSYVPGRYLSAVDVLIFDNFGALFSLWIVAGCGKRKRPAGTSG
jgi:VanZ family protein